MPRARALSLWKCMLQPENASPQDISNVFLQCEENFTWRRGGHRRFWDCIPEEELENAKKWSEAYKNKRGDNTQFLSCRTLSVCLPFLATR